jgi:hypothetical protein
LFQAFALERAYPRLFRWRALEPEEVFATGRRAALSTTAAKGICAELFGHANGREWLVAHIGSCGHDVACG